MIDEKAYKTINKYAKKLCNEMDWRDIAQEACLLFLEYPSYQELSNKFWYTIIKRAKYRYYFNTNTKQLKYQDTVSSDYEEITNTIPAEIDLDNIILLKEFKVKAQSLKLGLKQDDLMQRVLKGEDWLHEDRGHIIHLRDKLRKIM